MISLDFLRNRVQEVSASRENLIQQRAQIDAQILLHSGYIDGLQQLIEEHSQPVTLNPFSEEQNDVEINSVSDAIDCAESSGGTEQPGGAATGR
jgi:hypothetical protein